MKCPNCNSEMIWQNDFDFEDYGAEGEGIVSIYSCGICETFSENYIPLGKTTEK